MIPLKLWYSHEQTEGDIARTHDELDAALDRVAVLSGPDWPVLAEVTQAADKFGPLLYVGLHVEQGALLYSGDDDEDGSYTTGSGTQDGEPLLYMQGTSDCEFPPNSEVSATLIRQAAHEFADTGLRPTCVLWQTWDRPDADTDSE
ncbi:MAG TPA: Imm1 family immunity protein [Pseudonocardiaceae bacterium]|nr:Imm1 family immunity protein [Pseudonocardiaceae bacterium]